ncbi:hypothetical protein H0H81_000415 [Sphagnurus paluster]|uniref:Uncharacterized protein n=1 Tax=Sphagnurus paluster TaxID=117069 RepID=A0A9P7FT54_9AGAR|nr:hypothetical protein H0H81_000415 [Sphagnurus paluster]
MYHQGFKCMVTGATSTAPVAVGKPPVWCEDDQSKCTKGAKQMIYWNQQDGNNIQVSGNDLSGHPKSPAYNSKLGFADGAQNDIFVQSTGGTAAAGSKPPVFPPAAPNNAPPAPSPSSTPAVGSSSGQCGAGRRRRRRSSAAKKRAHMF